MFCVKIDGKKYWEIENTEAKAFDDVQIFAGDKWYTPANGRIRNLKVSSRFHVPKLGHVLAYEGWQPRSPIINIY